MNKNKRPRGLGPGAGVNTLLGPDIDIPPRPVHANGEAGAPQDVKELRELPLASLQPGQYQPRTRMDDAALAELADSIRQHGLLQPIVVRPQADGKYEIIAGERRYRAATRLALRTVPVIVREVGNEDALALALIENIQREDLNPLEEANAIRRLIEEFEYTHERAAQAIGRSRSATSNLLRLLNLADSVQAMLMNNQLEMGHARALLPLDRADQILVAQQVVQRKLNVRETERVVQQTLSAAEDAAMNGGARGPVHRQGAATDPDVLRMQDRLADALGTRVELLSRTGGKGKLVIHFSGNDAFSGILERMNLGDMSDDAH